jgi:uncharacterized protein YkwD
MPAPGSSRPPASPRQRGWLLLYATVTLAVAAAVAAALVRPDTNPAGGSSVVAVEPAGASATAVVQAPVHKAAPVSAAAQRATPARTALRATVARAGQHSATAGSAQRATARSEARAGNFASQATPGPVGQVLNLINQARAKAGLSPYKILKGLERSSARHNARMANGCGLSHQCPGEPSLGARLTAAGVHWTSAGENIGEGGPVANTQTAIAKMALALTRAMLNEKPPNDGHRKNILSKAFHHIGISVRRDSHGTVWMTQDFSN